MNIDFPSIAKFQEFVQLKDFKPPTKKEYLRHVRRLADHFHADPATLTEDQLRTYFLFLRQHKQFSGSAMSIAKAALQNFFREHLGHSDWKVFSELVIRRNAPLPLVLSREDVQRTLNGLREERFRICLRLIYHCGLRVGEAVKIEVSDIDAAQLRLHIRLGKGGKDRYVPVTSRMIEQLRALFKQEPKYCYDLLFDVSSQALKDAALSKLGGEVAALGVLHTWSRQLIFHPHVHYIVPGGFLSPDQRRWIRLKDSNYLLPEKVLSRRTRNLFRTALQARPELVAQVPSAVWRKEWILNTQPVGSGTKALAYLGQYVQRTALSSQRIVKEENRRTTFQYRASDTGAWKRLTLDTTEFLRRFLQHVLPGGFHRVRYFGWWSPAAKTKWARILALLDWKEPSPPPKRAAWVKTCPCCGKPMQRVGMLPRGPPR